MTRVERAAHGEVRWLKYNHYRLGYEVLGSGQRVVVLLPGILLDANCNRRWAMGLADRGYQVVLLDLLGHGLSDKPHHASLHRMDLYAQQVIRLLDEMEVQEVVVGGFSLGADVSLQTAVLVPERIKGLILEMPVLEWATPAVASLFVPSLLAVHYAAPAVRAVTRLIARLPRTGIWTLDSVLNAASLDPDELTAVLHGVLLGPIAPTAEQRARVMCPAIVIGHRADLIHPFSDADNLAHQLPNARLVQAKSPLELRTRPARLTAEIGAFLDEVWASGSRR